MPADTLIIIKTILRNAFRYISPTYSSPPPSSYDLLLFDFEFIRQSNLCRMRKLKVRLDEERRTEGWSEVTAVHCHRLQYN